MKKYNVAVMTATIDLKHRFEGTPMEKQYMFSLGRITQHLDDRFFEDSRDGWVMDDLYVDEDAGETLEWCIKARVMSYIEDALFIDPDPFQITFIDYEVYDDDEDTKEED